MSGTLAAEIVNGNGGQIFIVDKNVNDKDLTPLIASRGYTLLEIMVAMVLVSTVTLIATMALRLSMNAWERGRQEGEVGALSVTLPLLLEHQLTSLVDQAAFPAKKRLSFDGRSQGLSFFTSYAPRGAGAGGVKRVTYRYEEEQKTLWIYLQVVTRAEQLKAEYDPLSTDWNRDLKPVSQLTGIDSLTFEYNVRPHPVFTDDDHWQEKYEKIPSGVRLQLTRSGRKKAESWFFTVAEGQL
ncbi:MAG: prepilin-type N-terminal cleavage/methylation domain-containing protein [Deltaproteobacteria bacterium]|nr:prepilin-type N-terminal cleavage/methylation domain-containing protein [Deltaproteobacteria bacterium]